MAELQTQTHIQPEQMHLTEQRTKIGTKRSYLQIEKTIKFDFLRNGMKFISMLIMSFLIFALFLIIEIIDENNGAIVPTDPADYFEGYLMMISFIILIVASTFGGSMIAEDFEKQTGNLLFPKITKDRLLFGRFIARYSYSAISVTFYYILVAIATFLKYNAIPKFVWGSLGWALLYTFALLSFVTFFSAIMKRSSSATIYSILIVLIVFQLLTMILMVTGVTIEPFFMLTYYSNIITSWFHMPEERYMELPFHRGPEGISENTFYSWITPSATGAVIGMLVWSVICLTIAYLVFRRRQKK